MAAPPQDDFAALKQICFKSVYFRVAVVCEKWLLTFSFLLVFVDVAAPGNLSESHSDSCIHSIFWEVIAIVSRCLGGARGHGTRGRWNWEAQVRFLPSCLAQLCSFFVLLPPLWRRLNSVERFSDLTKAVQKISYQKMFRVINRPLNEFFSVKAWQFFSLFSPIPSCWSICIDTLDILTKLPWNCVKY